MSNANVKSRTDFLNQAEAIINKPVFSKEDSARVQALLDAAEVSDPRGQRLMQQRVNQIAREVGLPVHETTTEADGAELCTPEFRSWLRGDSAVDEVRMGTRCVETRGINTDRRRFSPNWRRRAKRSAEVVEKTRQWGIRVSNYLRHITR